MDGPVYRKFGTVLFFSAVGWNDTVPLTAKDSVVEQLEEDNPGMMGYPDPRITWTVNTKMVVMGRFVSEIDDISG